MNAYTKTWEFTYLKLTVINCPDDVIGSDGAMEPQRP